MQELLSATAGGTTTNRDNIPIVNGSIADSYINKSVTYDGQPSDLANPTVKLAGAGDVVIGSIVGVSYGKLQIAVSGWDVRFIQSGTTALALGARIVGATVTIGGNAIPGFVAAVGGASDPPTQAEANAILAGRGAVLHGGDVSGTPTAGSVIVRVTMRFGS